MHVEASGRGLEDRRRTAHRRRGGGRSTGSPGGICTACSPRYRDGGLEAARAASRRPQTNPARHTGRGPSTGSSSLRAAADRARVSMPDRSRSAGTSNARGCTVPVDLDDPPILTRAGLITPEPRKRPRSSYVRFEAAQPNETWQSDFTHWRLADGTDIEILNWLDDHSRSCCPAPPTGPSPATTSSPRSSPRPTSTASPPPP